MRDFLLFCERLIYYSIVTNDLPIFLLIMKVKLRDKIEYMVAVISEFESKFRLTDVQAYRYLNFHKGISFLMDNYNILYTLDFNEAVESVALFCRKSGGKL